jgi:diacylglycerol kinase family enzyme
VNRHARRGGEAINDVLDRLAGRGMKFERHDFANKHPIPEAIRARAQGFGCVIVGGGDGTLHEATPAVVEVGLRLGIVALGTANDLA